MIGDLTDSEQRLIDAVAQGHVADFTTGDPEKDNPSKGEAWGPERTLRAEILRTLCLGFMSNWHVDPRGVRLRGARITSSLDLNSGTIVFPFELLSCHVHELVEINSAATRKLDFSGSWFGEGLRAVGIASKGSLHLSKGFIAKRGVYLSGSHIGGQLNCSGGSFENPDGAAVLARGIVVAHSFYLSDGFTAKGIVQISGADIGGQLVCRGGRFENPEGPALLARSVLVKESAFLHKGFTAHGTVDLDNADIGCDLVCTRGRFESRDDTAIRATSINVEGNMFLDATFTAKGVVNLATARIGGVLKCSGGRFENPEGTAILGVRMTANDGVLLNNGFIAKGEVKLNGSHIHGELDCCGGSFDNPGLVAIRASGTTTNGSVHLGAGFTAKGEVALFGAVVGGEFVCSGGRFENPSGRAISAYGITITGSAHLNAGFFARGEVALIRAEIGDQLHLSGGHFVESLREIDEFEPRLPLVRVGPALSLAGTRIKGWLNCRSMEVTGQVILLHCKVDGLLDCPEDWPRDGDLFLDGFEYDTLVDPAPTSAKERIDWLRRQPVFRPQPYEQAIRVLRRLGHDKDAREVAIEKQREWRRRGQLSLPVKLGNWCLDVTVAHGYRPFRALWYMLFVWLFGALVFYIGHSHGLVGPSDPQVFLHPMFVSSDGNWLPSSYPHFFSLLYSLDVLLPIVDLHQESRWLPITHSELGWALWAYMWLHIVIGWVLTSIFVAALTGLVKKD